MSSPQRPTGDPPKNLQTKSTPNPNPPKPLKRPPPPPQKPRDDNEDDDLDADGRQPLSKRKPPPSNAPPDNATKELRQQVPPKPKQALQIVQSKDDTTRGAEAKTGGIKAARLPPPGAPPSINSDNNRAANKDEVDNNSSANPNTNKSPARRRPPTTNSPPPPTSSQQPLQNSTSRNPTISNIPVQNSTPPPLRPGSTAGLAPPSTSQRPPAPYRPPPGAPSGKSPPRQAPPKGSVGKVSVGEAAGLQVAKIESNEKSRRPVPLYAPPVLDPNSYPKGRMPPSGAPPGAKPRAPTQLASRADEMSNIGNEDFPELNQHELVPMPFLEVHDVPDAPDSAPPDINNNGSSDIGAPRGAPPRGAGDVTSPNEDISEESRMIAQAIKRGRLNVKIIEAENIRRKDQTSDKARIDTYVVVQLGDVKKSKREKTDVMRKESMNPDFKGQVLKFDVNDPAILVRNNDIKIKIEIYSTNDTHDELLGSVTLSALRFLSLLNPISEWLPLTFPGDDTSNSRIHAEFSFSPAKVGMAVFTIYEGKSLGLINNKMKSGGKQLSPYISLSVGESYHKRSQVQVSGGADPYFGEEQILMWIDQDNWVEDCILTAWSEDVGEHDVIGKSNISLLPFMVEDSERAMAESVEIYNERLGGRSAGEIVVKIQFLEAGALNILIKSGKDLRMTESVGQLDPYIVMKADGYAVKINKKSTIDKDGGTHPSWNQLITMDVVDHYQLQVECYDHDVLAGEDELIGKASVSLLPVFKKGHIDTWITLKHKNQYGVLTDAGEVHVVFDFKAKHGLSYPQHRPGVDSFDDSQRIDYEKVRELEEKRRNNVELNVAETKSLAVLAQDVMEGDDAEQATRYDCGFTDADIRSAFEFIDLDHNDFVGAAEIRHVLICMGELITDEEVDMMITMVDTDGDGQVGYDEFYMMVSDEDPARPNFGKRDDNEKKETDQSRSFERQKEMAVRDTKRRMLTQFVNENQIGTEEIKFAWDTYSQIQRPSDYDRRDLASGNSGNIDFEVFCEILRVEPTGEYHKMFGLFDSDGSGTVSIKEFILGLCNFVEMVNDKKCKFIFDLFDSDHSGFLAINELEEILMANHMQSRKACGRKAATIMRAADLDGSGGINLQEFIVCSSKFPNILFPKHNA